MDRRRFVRKLTFLLSSSSILGTLLRRTTAHAEGYDPSLHYYGMGIQVSKCIGCGRCVEACKDENDVPRVPFFFRTWVERYVIKKDSETVVQSIEPVLQTRAEQVAERDMLRSFFVPKICNQCDNPPCVQVCPVGATFKTKDGVILVDDDRCIGCRYCIQACPYGARYLHPEKGTADKCSFCYHRITRGLLPACVEVCPTGAAYIDRSVPVVRVNEEECIGCGECVKACPFGAADFAEDKGVALICDLCNGDPACVEHCIYGALTFEPTQSLAQRKRRLTAEAYAQRDRVS